MLMIWYFQQIDTKTRMVMWSLPGWAQCHYNVLQGSGQNTRTMRKHQALQLMQRCQTLWLHLQWNISVVATRFCKALGIPKEYKIPSIVSLPFLLAANCCSKQLESLQEHSSVESLAVSSIWVQLFHWDVLRLRPAIQTAKTWQQRRGLHNASLQHYI